MEVACSIVLYCDFGVLPRSVTRRKSWELMFLQTTEMSVSNHVCDLQEHTLQTFNHV